MTAVHVPMSSRPGTAPDKADPPGFTRRNLLSSSNSVASHKQPVYAIAWSHNGRKLASASADGVVKVWSVALPDAPDRVSRVPHGAVNDIPGCRLQLPCCSCRALLVSDPSARFATRHIQAGRGVAHVAQQAMRMTFTCLPLCTWEPTAAHTLGMCLYLRHIAAPCFQCLLAWCPCPARRAARLVFLLFVDGLLVLLVPYCRRTKLSTTLSTAARSWSPACCSVPREMTSCWLWAHTSQSECHDS